MHSNGRFNRILVLFRMSLGVILDNRKLLLCSVATTGTAFALIVFLVAAPVLPSGIRFFQQVSAIPGDASARTATDPQIEINNLQIDAEQPGRLSASVSSGHATAFVN